MPLALCAPTLHCFSAPALTLHVSATRPQSRKCRSCSYGSRRPPDTAHLTGSNIINGSLTVAALLLPVFLLRRPGEAVMLGETTQALMCNLPERHFTGSSWSSNLHIIYLRVSKQGRGPGSPDPTPVITHQSYQPLRSAAMNAKYHN
ncbi:hypothetical protein IQ07DRAFT_47646 [Pyrenochaeta sp. DS3sAY3a]|nr:hypothetical protein IQ07DRAFT_47646 [Pyrenochaeta sp. DS3sAY3a]